MYKNMRANASFRATIFKKSLRKFPLLYGGIRDCKNRVKFSGHYFSETCKKIGWFPTRNRLAVSKTHCNLA